uniref:Uncharacterized protein n=1 Tax=Anguilla anguilla TaxID=7936 RepID=A0A0E9WPY6_ANGAN
MLDFQVQTLVIIFFITQFNQHTSSTSCQVIKYTEVVCQDLAPRTQDLTEQEYNWSC